MKSFVLLCLVFLFFFRVEAQNWTAPGAKWNYSFNELFSFGYISVEHIADTTINGKLCDVLEKNKFGYTAPGYYDTIALGHEYTYFDSGRVWVYRDNQFWILYDFNASVGSSWSCKGNNDSCQLPGEFYVDSIGSIVINNDTLKVIHTSPMPGSGYHFIGAIVEKIGCLGYMFPEPACIADAEEGGPFRCYSDNLGWSFESGISLTCDYINSVFDSGDQENFQIFPNPAFYGFSIKQIRSYGFEPIKMSIYDIQGKLIDEVIINSQNYYFNTSNIAPGIYSVSFQNSFKLTNIFIIINK